MQTKNTRIATNEQQIRKIKMQNKWNRWVEAFAEVAANQIQLSQSQSLQKPPNLFKDATKFNQVLP